LAWWQQSVDQESARYSAKVHLMIIGLYLFDNGDVCVEHPDASRLPMSRHEYTMRNLQPPFHELLSKADYDEFLLSRRMGDPPVVPLSVMASVSPFVAKQRSARSKRN
jgi:hypothetical protein